MLSYIIFSTGFFINIFLNRKTENKKLLFHSLVYGLSFMGFGIVGIWIPELEQYLMQFLIALLTFSLIFFIYCKTRLSKNT